MSELVAVSHIALAAYISALPLSCIYGRLSKTISKAVICFRESREAAAQRPETLKRLHERFTPVKD